jgi:hypothetical protein
MMMTLRRLLQTEETRIMSRTLSSPKDLPPGTSVIEHFIGYQSKQQAGRHAQAGTWNC